MADAYAHATDEQRAAWLATLTELTAQSPGEGGLVVPGRALLLIARTRTAG
jgi:hypothetical protein